MDPVSGALGGAQLLLSIQNMMNSSSAAAQNLQFQREQARKQERLGQAARTDAYGNKQYYDSATNTWKTELSPMQAAISKAGETEQFRSLTEDAQRNRQQRTRQSQRAEDAVVPYNKAMQEFLNNPTASEGSIRNEIGTLTALANQNRDKGNQANVIRQALRMGKGGSVQNIIKASDDRSGRGVADALLSARGQALQERGSREQQRQSAYLPIIQQLSNTIDAGGGSAATRFSDISSQLGNVQNQQASQMLSAIQGANTNVNNASRTAIAANSKQPDFSGLFKALQLQAKVKPEKQWDDKIPYSTTPDYMDNMPYGTDRYNKDDYLF